MVDKASSLASKRAALEGQLRSLGRTLVAYSGGVDSAFLAWVAHSVLGKDMLAMNWPMPSPSHTSRAFRWQ